MTFYLANYASQADFEAARDDFPFNGVEDMAYPVGLVLTDRTEAHIAALLDLAWEELTQTHEDDPIPDPDWNTGGWKEALPNGLRSHQIWTSEFFETVVILREVEPLAPKKGPE